MVKMSAARSCQGPSGIFLGSIGCMACVALCLVHISQFLHTQLYLCPCLANRLCLGQGVAFFQLLCGLHGDHVGPSGITLGVYIFCFLVVILFYC